MAEPGGTTSHSVPEAARLLGISERAVRKRIVAGSLAAERAGSGPWRVRLGAARAVPVGTGGGTGAVPIEAEYHNVNEVNAPPSVALVPLAAVADQLQGLADRLAELAERNEGLALEVGQLRERTATQQGTIAELRERLATAEAASAPPASPPVPAPPDTPNAPVAAPGFWQRLRRALGGE